MSSSSFNTLFLIFAHAYFSLLPGQPPYSYQSFNQSSDSDGARGHPTSSSSRQGGQAGPAQNFGGVKDEGMSRLVYFRCLVLSLLVSIL